MNTINRDVFSGAILAALAILLHLVIIPNQVESAAAGPIALSPSLFCHIIAALLLLLSLSLLTAGFRMQRAKGHSPVTAASGESQLTRGVIAVAVSVLYVVIMEPVGYFSSTAAAMVFFLIFFGARDWKGIAGFLVIILPFIYGLFVEALKVILPRGFIF